MSKQITLTDDEVEHIVWALKAEIGRKDVINYGAVDRYYEELIAKLTKSQEEKK